MIFPARLSNITKDNLIPMISDLQVVGMREDYKRKRNWCIMISDKGVIHTGYYGYYRDRPDNSSITQERSYHPVFRSEMAVSQLYRGQSGFQIDFRTPHEDQTIDMGATGILMLLKAIASGKIEIKNGRFVFDFVLEKKGSNVYAEPYFGEIKDLI